MTEQKFAASGKLLLFGEYLVLRGSRCLTLPLSFSQRMTLKKDSGDSINWQSFETGKCWFEATFSKDIDILYSSDHRKALFISKLLQIIKAEKVELFSEGLHFRLDLDFDRNYGFGSSSTLISLLAQWSGADPYLMLSQTIGGSGYDIAAAQEVSPFVYSMNRKVESICRLPERVTNNLLFVYLGKKQDSSKAVIDFKNRAVDNRHTEQMNHLVDLAVSCQDIESWEHIMNESEVLLSSVINQPKVKDLLFADYPFAIKSLGAWGGDFVMATYRNIADAKVYFKEYNPVFTFNELVKKQ